MKTSEFIEYFEDKGLRVFNFEDGRIVVQNNYSNTLISLTDREFVVAVGYFPFDKQQEYYKVILEYLMTPLEEREEEKKYKLQQKGVSKRFLIWLKELGKYTIGVFPYENENVKTDFTQSEIDEMPECYTHPAVWEQIEVEIEDLRIENIDYKNGKITVCNTKQQNKDVGSK